MPLAIGQERLETNIKADIRMLTSARSMLLLWLGLTDDEGIPMPICTQDKMHGFRSTENLAMKLDLEEVPQLLGDNEVFLILMQLCVFAVLPELDRVPTVLQYKRCFLSSKLRDKNRPRRSNLMVY